MDDIYNWFSKNIDKTHVHGSNILTKIKNIDKTIEMEEHE